MKQAQFKIEEENSVDIFPTKQVDFYFTFQDRCKGFRNKVVKISAHNKSIAKGEMSKRYANIWKDAFLEDEIDLSQYEIINEYIGTKNNVHYFYKTFSVVYTKYIAEKNETVTKERFYKCGTAQDAFKMFITAYLHYNGSFFVDCKDKVTIREFADSSTIFEVKNDKLVKSVKELKEFYTYSNFMNDDFSK